MSYDRYLNRGQKVYLINVSDNRDTSVYESLSGSVITCDESRVTIRCPYRLFSGDSVHLESGSILRLTTEAFGMGIQVNAELVGTPASETLTLKLFGLLESYQRRSVPRVDTVLPHLFVPQKSSLQAFKREWKRVITDLHKPIPPHLKLHQTGINLSAGGVGLESIELPTPLSIMVIDLLDQKPPVCAVAELIWQRQNEERTLVRSGHRFIEIRKEDQTRIAEFVSKATGDRTMAMKNRELMS